MYSVTNIIYIEKFEDDSLFLLSKTKQRFLIQLLLEITNPCFLDSLYLSVYAQCNQNNISEVTVVYPYNTDYVSHCVRVIINHWLNKAIIRVITQSTKVISISWYDRQEKCTSWPVEERSIQNLWYWVFLRYLVGLGQNLINLESQPNINHNPSNKKPKL